MNLKTLLRTLAIISFFVMGTLVISQLNDNLGPDEEGLSTQAIDTCVGQICDRVNVNRLYVHTNGFLYVSTSGMESSLSCTPLSTYYIQISNQTENYKETYTLLLSAKLNSMPVTIRVTNDANCTIRFVHFGDL